MSDVYDVVVVGSGPNGLAAAIVAARCGLSVAVFEANETIGGGMRSAELTIPDFVHDVCSAVHPMAVASPLFRSLPLTEHGLRWITPPISCAHPLDDGTAGFIANSLSETIRGLGEDGQGYNTAIGSISRNWKKLEADLLGPLGIPSHPVAFAKFGIGALMPATTYAKWNFSSIRAQALFAGTCAHAMIPLEYAGSASFGLVLAAVAHIYGWPVVQGGSQALASALASYFQSLGGIVVTGRRITSLKELPQSRIVLFDTSPGMMAQILGDRLSDSYRRALLKFRHGPGTYKVDWALAEPIPWTAAECRRAGTVHVGGTLHEIAYSERLPWQGEHAEHPFVLVTQPSVFDPTRAPKGKHTAWGYCHVPNGSSVDMTERIETQIERFAPGFRDVILARSSHGPADLEQGNANLVGGDIGGGANMLHQLFLRPTRRLYATGADGMYLCSASTPPGGGVHGMCGYHAAVQAIGDVFGKTMAESISRILSEDRLSHPTITV